MRLSSLSSESDGGSQVAHFEQTTLIVTLCVLYFRECIIIYILYSVYTDCIECISTSKTVYRSKLFAFSIKQSRLQLYSCLHHLSAELPVLSTIFALAFSLI